MKLFQIEEPEGGPSDPDAAGAAVGVDASAGFVEVALSVGGNAVVEPVCETFVKLGGSGRPIATSKLCRSLLAVG